MLNRAVLSLTVLSVLSLSDLTLGRNLWLERDDKPVFLYPRRFGQQNAEPTGELGQACPGQVCGVLSGQSIKPLLANSGVCDQQDMADQIIGELRSFVKYVFLPISRPDASKQFDSATQQKMTSLAVQYRALERNTSPVCLPMEVLKDNS